MAKSRESGYKSQTDRERENKKSKKGCYGRKKKTYSARNIDSYNEATLATDNSNKTLPNGVDQTDFNRSLIVKESSQFYSDSKLSNNNNNNNNNNNSNDENQKNDNFNRLNNNRNNNFNSNYSEEINEKVERTVIDRNRNKSSGRLSDSNKRENINQNFYSKSPTESVRQSSSSKKKQVYDTTYFNRNVLSSRTSNHNNLNSLIVGKSFSKVHNNSLNSKPNGLLPVLKTNKTYDISFTLSNIPSQNLNRTLIQPEIETVEYSKRNIYSNNEQPFGHYKNTNDKVLQTGSSLRKFNQRASVVQFDELMKDVNMNEKNQNYNVDMTDSKIDKNSNSTQRFDTNNKLARKEISYKDKTIAEGNGGQSGQSMYENRNKNVSEIIYSEPSMNGNVAATEYNEIKEWMIVEFPDGHQEKREFRKEINEEGDANYIDVVNKTILKTDKASWKSGNEYMKNNREVKRVKYEWRKDPSTNSWVKYDATTNEILKQGDWKSGSEWVRNSKGKLEERPYKYIRNQAGQWIKVDTSSGQIIDYSNCSALQGYDWISNKNKKLKDRRWKKRDYKYVENNKGKWDKIDEETKKKIGKSTKSGWKEGIDYHMDKEGKVYKVRYIWETKESGLMEKVNKRNKKPINYSWKEGREIIMRGDAVTTTNFAWVNLGKNTWIKIDRDTGVPITGKVKSREISSHNLPTSMSNRKSLVTKTTKRIDNDKIVEEKLKIEQTGGGVIKNTTKTTQYVK